jgi:hypothetical protein
LNVTIISQVENRKLPGLVIALTLQHCHRQTQMNPIGPQLNEVVSFVSGLLFGKDEEVRKWFAQYVKLGQKV